MKTNIRNQLKDIEKNIEDLSKFISKRTAEYAKEDLEEARKQIIDDFYSYQIKSPEHNKRTYLLKYVVKVDKVSGKDYKNSASIKIDGDAVTDEYGHGNPDSHVTADFVTNLIWNEGIRGLPEGGGTVDREFSWYTPDGTKKYKPGDTWTNPYWNQSKYENEFRTKLHIGKFNSYKATPDKTMEKFVNQWGNKRLDDVLDKVKQESKNKFNLD